MGRRKLYETKEEQAAAARARSARYYASHRVAICKARKEKYQPKPHQKNESRQASMNDEEKKVKNRLKSQRYYQRHKSTIQRKRNAKGTGRRVNWNFLSFAVSSNCYASMWYEGLQDISSEVSKALGGVEVPDFVESIAIDYLECGMIDRLSQAADPFREIILKIERLEASIVKDVGAGAHWILDKVKTMYADVWHVIDLLDDLVFHATDHDDVAGFISVYKKGILQHHRLYYEPRKRD